MPETATPEAVSGATEATSNEADASTTDTQAGEQQATEQQPKRDPRKLLQEDPDLAEYFNSQVQRAVRKGLEREQRRTLREQAAAAASAKDANAALEVATRVAAEQDPEDQADQAFLVKARSADAEMAAVRKTAEYAALFKEIGTAAMNRRWKADPEAFADWVHEEVLERKASSRAKKIARELAKAEAEDMTMQTLGRTPAPITGASGGGGRLTPEQYLAMPAAERIELKKKNPALVDEMVARAAR